MKIDLLGGDYQPRSIIASTQRRLNLYSEMIDPKQGEPAQVVHYPTPGLRLLGHTPNGKPIRGIYRASNGDLYCAAGFDIYYIDPKWKFNLVGTINTTKTLNPVKFADNGTSVVLADGTPSNGWSINMKTRNSLSPLYNPSVGDAETVSSNGWLGSTYLDYADGFIIANSPGTPAFYISNSQDVIFDPSQFASKDSYPDDLVAAIASRRLIWLIGELLTEIWYNSGGGSLPGQTFPYEIMPGVQIDWGCRATYSIARGDSSVFWLAQNRDGETVVVRGTGYAVTRISNHAIEYIFSTYQDVTDAIGYCVLVNGHTWYVLNFPSADATWAFDQATGHWHQLAWIDDNGQEHRHRSTMYAYAYGTNVVNDWENGNLYALDQSVFTDNGRPIKRMISFPREVDAENGHRVVFRSFIAEIDCGETTDPAANTTMMLSWSDDKGRTFSNSMPQSVGLMGKFNKVVKWQRLGWSRNRVFRLEWTTDAMVAVQGAYVEVTVAGS